MRWRNLIYPKLWEVLHECRQQRRQVICDLLNVGGKSWIGVDVTVTGTDRVVDEQYVDLFDLKSYVEIHQSAVP